MIPISNDKCRSLCSGIWLPIRECCAHARSPTQAQQLTSSLQSAALSWRFSSSAFRRCWTAGGRSVVSGTVAFSSASGGGGGTGRTHASSAARSVSGRMRSTGIAPVSSVIARDAPAARRHSAPLSKPPRRARCTAVLSGRVGAVHIDTSGEKDGQAAVRKSASAGAGPWRAALCSAVSPRPRGPESRSSVS